mgnify:CR=1 FL=1
MCSRSSILLISSVWAALLVGCLPEPAPNRPHPDGAFDSQDFMPERSALDVSVFSEEPSVSSDIARDATVLADGTVIDSAMDTSVDRLSNHVGVFDSPARRITADCGLACVILASGSVYCWGAGSLHNGGTTVEERLRPRRIEGLRQIEQLSTSCDVGCGVDRSQDVWCWGSNYVNLQTGSSDAYLNVARRRMDVTNISQVSMWTAAFLGRHADGALYLRLGSPEGLMRFSLPGSVIDLDASQKYCVALSTGSVACSGSHPASPPVLVEGIDSAVSVTVGSYHYCALKRDGTVWCWGQNEYGQTGIAPEDSSQCPGMSFIYRENPAYPFHWCVPRPRQVPGLTDVAEVHANARTTCARKRDGTVWCWGYNGAGLVGDGLPTTEVCPSPPWNPASLTPPPVACRRRPSRVAGLTDVISLAVGGVFGCALQSTGAIWCWGAGGTLGNGTEVPSPVPVLVPASAPPRDE